MRHIGWLLVLGLLLGGCAEGVSGQAPLFDLGFIVIEATPADAQVFIDGRPSGRARDFVGQVVYLKDGIHTVEIVAPGFRSFSYRFQIDSSFPAYVRVALRQEPPRAPQGS